MSWINAIGDIIVKYWWVWFVALPLLFLYMKFKKGESIFDLKLREMWIAIVFIAALLVIYLAQIYLFNDHIFWIMGILFAMPWMIFIFYMLQEQHNYYMIEDTMQAETFWDLKLIEKKIATRTASQLHIIPAETWKNIKHVGDASNLYWNGSDRFKFADFFDQKELVCYHPEHPQMRNWSFRHAKTSFLYLKQQLPKVMDENTKWAILFEIKLQHALDVMKEEFPMFMRENWLQHKREPFPMPESMDDIMKRILKEKRKSELEHEKLIKPEDAEKELDK